NRKAPGKQARQTGPMRKAPPHAMQTLKRRSVVVVGIVENVGDREPLKSSWRTGAPLEKSLDECHESLGRDSGHALFAHQAVFAAVRASEELSVDMKAIKMNRAAHGELDLALLYGYVDVWAACGKVPPGRGQRDHPSMIADRRKPFISS